MAKGGMMGRFFAYFFLNFPEGVVLKRKGFQKITPVFIFKSMDTRGDKFDLS